MSKSMVLRNALSRPVEIHLADRVEVILPGGKLLLEESALSDPGIRPLLRSGAVSCFEPPANRTPKQIASRRRGAKPASVAGSERAETRGKKRAAAAPEVSPAAPAKHPASTAGSPDGGSKAPQVETAAKDPIKTETGT